VRAWAAWAAFLLVAAPVATGQEPAASSEEGSDQPQRPPPVLRLSLRDAVDLGLARNLGLRSARLGALMARIDVAIEEAAWDPTFTGVVTGGETQIPSRSTLAGADVVDTDHFNFALGLQKPTRLGPVLGIDWRSDRVFTNSTARRVKLGSTSSCSKSAPVAPLRQNPWRSLFSVIRLGLAVTLPFST